MTDSDTADRQVQKSLPMHIDLLIGLAEKYLHPFPLIRQAESPRTDIFGWLASQKIYPRFYWRNRAKSVELGAVGRALDISPGMVSPILQSSADPEPLILFAQRFDGYPRPDPLWRPYAERLCFFPGSIIRRTGVRFIMMNTVAVAPGESIDVIRSKINDGRKKHQSGQSVIRDRSLPSIKTISHSPNREEWRRNIDRALKAIDDGFIEKIVLARRTDLAFGESIDPRRMFVELAGFHQSGYAFYFQPDESTAFFSFSPERLFCREENRLTVDALSSTVPRGCTADDDRGQEKRLLSDDKLRREHRAVVDGINQEALPLYASPPDSGETGIYKLEQVQHLHTSVAGLLREGIGDEDIIAALHPTPAVGGRPTDRALELIRQWEPFERGWYASPAGYFSPKRSEGLVAIRSAVVRGSVVSAFSGAGIVAGSGADEEWQELEGKSILRPWLERNGGVG